MDGSVRTCYPLLQPERIIGGWSMRRFGLAAFGSLLALAGCAGEYGPKETGGALLGAGAGAVAGSQFGSGTGRIAATALGTLIGAAVGSSAGRSLDRADAAYAERYYAAPQQVPRPYIAPRTYYAPEPSSYSGYSYSGFSSDGCRYVGRGSIGEPTYACRAPNGAWYISR
jgi:surface antigen